MAEVQFLGIGANGFPSPDVTRDVRPTSLPEVENFGVTATIVSPGQAAGVSDDPNVTFSDTLPSPPTSVSPASATVQPLSAPLRASTDPAAPPPTTTVIRTVLLSGAQAQTLDGQPLSTLVGQNVRFSSDSRTVALRNLLRRLIAAVVNPAGWSMITVDPALPALPLGTRLVSAASYYAPVAVADATNASPIVIETAAPHGLLAGARVVISGVGGNLAANGTWTITVLDGTHFSLNGSAGSGAYTAGGSVEQEIVVTTATPHGYATGDRVTITGVVGNTAANVTDWSITVLGPTTFRLDGQVGNGVYVGGGVVTGPTDTFFIEQDPATIQAKLFGTGNLVAQQGDATIYETVPSKEVILS